MNTLLAAGVALMLVGLVIALDAWRELLAGAAVSGVILSVYFLLT